MTLVVGVLSPEYALALADTYSIITLDNPATVALPGGGTFTLPAGQPLEGQNPHKIRFSANLEEAFAFAGTSNIGDEPLGLPSGMVGVAADEHIARKLGQEADAAGFAKMPAGNYAGTAALHIYRCAGRFIASAFFGSAVRGVVRLWTRCCPHRLLWVAIGSGEGHVAQLLTTPHVAEQWEDMAREIGTNRLDHVEAFWAKVIGAVSTRQNDVNNVVVRAVRTIDTGTWQVRPPQAYEWADAPWPSAEAPHLDQRLAPGMFQF